MDKKKITQLKKVQRPSVPTSEALVLQGKPTFFFPQLVATFPFLLVPSVGVSVPLQLSGFSPVRYQDKDKGLQTRLKKLQVMIVKFQIKKLLFNMKNNNCKILGIFKSKLFTK